MPPNPKTLNERFNKWCQVNRIVVTPTDEGTRRATIHDAKGQVIETAVAKCPMAAAELVMLEIRKIWRRQMERLHKMQDEKNSIDVQ